MSTGAVVLSNGDARAAANHTNNQNNTSNQQNSATFSTDSDLTKLSTDMGYNQKLYDVNILSFDIRPAVSGKITFSYVFGSEEYEEYSPKTITSTSTYNDLFGFFITPAGSSTDNLSPEACYQRWF
ncbi:hypothetical protein OEZ86_006208 [Tetradesmus obliquus]|nr:hypothetical protein OEZ86_006208 [Tetradesmus obliquus]